MQVMKEKWNSKQINDDDDDDNDDQEKLEI